MLHYAKIPDWLWSKREQHHLSFADFLDVSEQGKLARILCQADFYFYKLINLDNALSRYVEGLGFSMTLINVARAGNSDILTKTLSESLCLMDSGLTPFVQLKADLPPMPDRVLVDKCLATFPTAEGLALSPLFSRPVKYYTWHCVGIVDETVLLVPREVTLEVLETIAVHLPPFNEMTQLDDLVKTPVLHEWVRFQYIRLLETILQHVQQSTHHDVRTMPLLLVYIEAMSGPHNRHALTLPQLEEMFTVVDTSVLPEYTS